MTRSSSEARACFAESQLASATLKPRAGGAKNSVQNSSKLVDTMMDLVDGRRRELYESMSRESPIKLHTPSQPSLRSGGHNLLFGVFLELFMIPRRKLPGPGSLLFVSLDSRDHGAPYRSRRTLPGPVFLLAHSLLGRRRCSRFDLGSLFSSYDHSSDCASFLRRHSRPTFIRRASVHFTGIEPRTASSGCVSSSDVGPPGPAGPKGPSRARRANWENRA